MNNHKEKDCYKNKKAKKESENNITTDVVYNELLIKKTSNQDHNSETFIPESGDP